MTIEVGDDSYVFPTNPINALEASHKHDPIDPEELAFPTNPINALEART